MEVQQKIDYWIDIAAYDLETASAMLETGRYLYVGFLCHQTVEKLLKAYYWKSIHDEPPYSHNLLLLAEKSNLAPLLHGGMDGFLNRLMPLNIQARYPQDKDELLKILTSKMCDELLHRTKEFAEWINQLLKK
jgi:HEPN domain-containing protein